MNAAAPAGLSRAERLRRGWHMLPGLLPVVLWFVPHADPVSPTLRLIAFAVLISIAATVAVRWRRVARRADEPGTASVLGYAGSVALLLTVLPGHAECAFAVLGVLAFGDGSATLVGKSLGGPRLPWNREKSLAGFAAFIAVGVPMTALLYWGERTNPEALDGPVTPATAWAVACAGVLPAAVSESVDSAVNDNVRVGLTAVVCVVAAHFAWAA